MQFRTAPYLAAFISEGRNHFADDIAKLEWRKNFLEFLRHSKGNLQFVNVLRFEKRSCIGDSGGEMTETPVIFYCDNRFL